MFCHIELRESRERQLHPPILVESWKTRYLRVGIKLNVMQAIQSISCDVWMAPAGIRMPDPFVNCRHKPGAHWERLIGLRRQWSWLKSILITGCWETRWVACSICSLESSYQFTSVQLY